MITKFELFESIHSRPKVGDYVIIKCESRNVIGEITEITLNFTYPYKVNFIEKYYNKEFVRTDTFKLESDGDGIEFWSNSKEELETLLASNKFNI